MPITFHPLPLNKVSGPLGYTRPTQQLPESVEPDNPALDVMTDLARVSAVTTVPGTPIDDALNCMINDGVRLLLVTNADDDVIGLITASDIQGEKPMRVTQETGTRHADITVGDIMTPIDAMEVLDMDSVKRSHVGDIVRTLTTAGRQHALVVENCGGRSMIRGIFSTTQIGRLLGMPVKPSEKAQTFAELETAIAS